MSPPSFRSINYTIRPAKSVERKFLVDIAGRLRRVVDTSQLQYIGFGSTFFSDFSVIHRALGCETMVSIERDVAHQDRFELNKPYGCIEMVWGDSTSVLPQLALSNKPALVWLDYDDPFEGYMLEDVRTLCFELPSPSVFLVSTNVEPRSYGNSPKQRFDYFDSEFPNRLDKSKYSNAVQATQVRSLIYELINTCVLETTVRRNAGAKDNPSYYKQLMHYRYKDDARMLSVGGVLYSQLHTPSIASCDFESLFHVRTGPEEYVITVPTLTLRERREIDKSLPNGTPSISGISDGDVGKYQALYRYFPEFAEVEL